MSNYTYEELPLQHGQKVRAKKDSPIGTWSKYVGTVIGYRIAEDGTFEYKVRAWRANQHWWKEEHLDLVENSDLCVNCQKLLDVCPEPCNCGNCC